MTADARERFLEEPRVGIVVHLADPGDAPLATPVWYAYERGGDIRFVTAASSNKVRRLRTNPNATFIVQDEHHPQRYVAVTGTASLRQNPTMEVRRTIAGRYLPDDMLDGFLEMSPGSALVEVSIVPRRWRSVDFGRLATPHR